MKRFLGLALAGIIALTGAFLLRPATPALAWSYNVSCSNGNIVGTISFPAGSAPFFVNLEDHVPAGQFQNTVPPTTQLITPDNGSDTVEPFSLPTTNVRPNANSVRVTNSVTNEKSASIPPCFAPTETPTDTPTATNTPTCEEAENCPTDTPTATNTPVDTATPTETNTPRPTRTPTEVVPTSTTVPPTVTPTGEVPPDAPALTPLPFAPQLPDTGDGSAITTEEAQGFLGIFVGALAVLFVLFGVFALILAAVLNNKK